MMKQNNYGLEVPVEIVEISDKKEIDRLKKKSELYSRLYNEQLKLNNVFKKEIGLSELKQWSPSATARQILTTKDFEPIVKKLLDDYSEIEINKFQSKICEIIKEEIIYAIVNIHNKTLEKEKNRIIEELKSVKKAVRNFE